MNNFDCIIFGKKLKSGSTTNKESGEVRPWSDIYTDGGSLVRVYGFDSSSLPDMATVSCHCNVNLYDGRLFVKFIKVVK